MTSVLALAFAAPTIAFGCGGGAPVARIESPRAQGGSIVTVRVHDALEACTGTRRAPSIHRITRRPSTTPAGTTTSGSAHVRVALERRLSRSFELIDVALALDDRCLRRVAWNPDAQNADPERRAMPPFEGDFAAGPHRLRAYVVLRSRATPYGIFSMSYRAYRFTLRTTHDFVLSAGERATMRVVVLERGSITTPIEDRPAIEIRW